MAWKSYTEISSGRKQGDLQSAMDKYCAAKRAYASKSIGLENIWRELCHAYEADRSNYKDLPILAAQHLIDGFALEILDGDAGRMSNDWIDAVLRHLDLKLKNQLNRSANIFVLSIMGTQSTGKSTLLNTMFVAGPLSALRRISG